MILYKRVRKDNVGTKVFKLVAEVMFPRAPATAPVPSPAPAWPLCAAHSWTGPPARLLRSSFPSPGKGCAPAYGSWITTVAVDSDTSSSRKQLYSRTKRKQRNHPQYRPGSQCPTPALRWAHHILQLISLVRSKSHLAHQQVQGSLALAFNREPKCKIHVLVTKL